MASPTSISSLNNDNIPEPRPMSMAQKRAASDSSNKRALKRRAHKACLSCRNRKVRCDVVSRGQPCTNCRLDGVDCAVKESNRGRKPANACRHQAVSGQSRSSQTSRPSVASVTCLDPALPQVEMSPADILSPPQQPADERRSSRALSLPYDEPEQQGPLPPPEQRPLPPLSHAVPSTFDIDHISPRNQQHVQSTLSSVSDPWMPPQQRVSTASPNVPSSNSGAIPRLPPYIRPVPAYLRQRDLQYLADSGALTIPDDAFRDELLRTYVHVVYPFMPAVDLDDFLGPIANGDGNPVSLLLFQAVMFAGVTFVDAKFLQARGYDSRKAARKAFFSRVRLLYGLDYEQDRLPLLQAVLLMTYWYDCPDNDKDTWYWMGIALSLAQVSGFHREPAMASVKQRRLRRRIWWSCVIRDRLLALGVRRPSRIYDSDFRVEPLSVDDFDVHVPPEPLIRLLGESRYTAVDSSARVQTAVLCVELSKLCTCLGRILHSQYCMTGSQAARSDYLQKATVLPRQSDTQLQDLVMCDAELDAWVANQDPRAKYTPSRGNTPRASPGNNDDFMQVIQLHQAQLHMIYLTTISVLHKPQVFYSGANTDTDSSNAQRRASKAKIMDAAVAITNLAYSLKASNQLRFLSTSSVPAFLSASLIHLMDTRSPDDDVRSISIGRFYQCVGALQQLQDIYSSADYAIYFLRDVLKNANIDVPMVKLALLSPTADERSHQQRQVRSSRSASTCPSSASTTRGVHTPYQTQHPAQNQPAFYPELPLGRDRNNYFDAGMAPPPQNLPNGQFDTLSAANLFGGAQESGEFVFDPSLMSNWLDIDISVPPMTGFDVDSNFPVMNTAAFV
ncbi:hypothetical protein SEUCBS139899_003009 [Sporothrix eucalyptigena]